MLNGASTTGRRCALISNGVIPTGIRLWSLWDMLKFSAWEFVQIATMLERADNMAELYDDAHVMGQIKTARFKNIVNYIEKNIKEVPALKISLMCVQSLNRWRENTKAATQQEFKMHVGELRRTLERELSTITCLSISSEDRDYYENPELFGNTVTAAFPLARFDIDEAGKCIATDRDTAAVFHLMRVLENALNLLSARLGVSFENRNWQNVIQDIEAKIREIDKAGPSGDKEKWRANLHFYSEAATNFRYFKDAWRNYSMHVHDTYSHESAKMIYSHVRSFMTYLAEGLNAESQQGAS